jgi:hypothetical protein
MKNSIVKEFMPLSTKDAVMGVGRKFTDEELSEHILRTSGGKSKEISSLKRDLKWSLSKRLKARK